MPSKRNRSSDLLNLDAPEARPARRHADDGLAGAAASVDARRAPPRTRARRRDRGQGHARHRLPAHRHREDDGEGEVAAGGDHHLPHGLPQFDGQRPRLLPRGRKADGRRRSEARAGPARAPHRAEPPLVAPGLVRHARHGHRRDDRLLLRLHRARDGFSTFTNAPPARDCTRAISSSAAAAGTCPTTFVPLCDEFLERLSEVPRRVQDAWSRATASFSVGRRASA